MMAEQEAKAFQDDGRDGSQGLSALLSISLLRQALAKCQAPGTPITSNVSLLSTEQPRTSFCLSSSNSSVYLF